MCVYSCPVGIEHEYVVTALVREGYFELRSQGNCVFFTQHPGSRASPAVCSTKCWLAHKYAAARLPSRFEWQQANHPLKPASQPSSSGCAGPFPGPA
eukprot:1151885-Pelagomonas_calceolata.AAC.2